MTLSQLLRGWGQDRSLTGTATPKSRNQGLRVCPTEAGTPLALPRGEQPQTSQDTCPVGSFCPQTFLQKKEDNMLMQRRPAGRADEWDTRRRPRHRQHRLLWLRESPLTQPKVRTQGGEGPGAGAAE